MLTFDIFFYFPFFQQKNSSANAFDRSSTQSDLQLDSTACQEKKVDVQKLNDKCDKCSVLTEKCDALNAEIANLKEALQNLQMKESSNEEEIEDKYYEVESIIAHENRGRRTNRQLHFLIRWKKSDSSHDSWVSECDLQCPAILKQYKKTNNLI